MEFSYYIMVEIKFKLKPIEKKPSRKYRRGSKYDPILDAFLRSGEALSRINVDGVDNNYLNNQLKKRIEINNYSGSIDVSIINNEIYIENTDEFKEIKNELKTSLFTNYKINENSAKNILGIISSSSSDVIIKENKMEK